MKKSSDRPNKTKISIPLIVFLSFLGAVLLYFIVCCGITFIPMLDMLRVNKTACHRPGIHNEKPQEVYTLDSGARLSYFPGDTTEKNKYVIICPGGGYVVCSVESEGYPIAVEFNRLGYRAFVLEYRIGGASNSYQAPMDDLADAIRFVDGNAELFSVYPGLYSLCGFSAGGNLVGMFGTEEFGYARYSGVKKPNALILGYPWISPTGRTTLNAVEAIYRATINHNGATCFLGKDYFIDDMCVNLWVTPDYPRTYMMQGDSDAVLPVEDNGDLMEKALKENGVEYVYERCAGVNHGCGLALGTSAEGWLERAAAFEDERWYEEEFEPEPITCEEMISRAGGLICGVCHPNHKSQEVLDLGAEWIRIDISWPAYDRDGNPNVIYEWVKSEMKAYADQGLKVFAVTPYPKNYMEWGYDLSKEEDLLEIVKMSRFFVEDLKGIVSAFQVTNEMSEPQFRAPLTMQEAADFVGMQLKAMYRYRGDILIGYNMSATDFAVFMNYMKPYNDYCDYIGIDLYLGCFETMTRNFGFSAGTAWVWYAWRETHRPLIFTEFGYLSAGERMSDEDKLNLLHKYGAEGETVAEAEAYAQSHIVAFIGDADFPVSLRERLYLLCGDDEDALAETLFGNSDFSISYRAHLYMELEEGVGLIGYPHTPEGQAKYFTDFFENIIIPNEEVCGAIMYCLSDSERCYVCGQEHCPVETGWGLLDGEGNKKPSYDALKAAFEKWRSVHPIVNGEKEE